MGKISPTKLFIFFAYVCILENLVAISAIVEHKIPRNFSETDENPCQRGPWKYVKAEVGRVKGNCDESDMASFTNAVTCARAFLLDHRPYHAANFVYDFHRQNAGKIGFLVETLLHKLDLNPSFINKCTRKGDREMAPEYYHRARELMLKELDRLGIFEERNFYADEEDIDDHEDIDDEADDDNDDLLNGDEEVEEDIEVNFLD